MNVVLSQIEDLFLKIINLSLSMGSFPDCWKEAIVVAIHKSGPLDDPGNFRPIALLPIFSKILEKIVYNQLYGYFEQFVNDNQFGFLKGRSTETALLHVTNGIHSNIEKKQVTALTLLDMSKAFDGINHPILLAKMMRYGIKGTELNWFKTYLSNRSQRVRIGNEMSPNLNVHYGVPQGSILGPLLFLIAVNDLPSTVQHCDITMFADDVQLRASFRPRDANQTFNNIQSDLTSISTWC